jgi:hypothetical protein
MASPSEHGHLYVGWEPYRHPDYPIKDAHHNPYLPLNPQYGSTYSARDLWMEDRSVTEAELRKKIRALTPGAK